MHLNVETLSVLSSGLSLVLPSCNTTNIPSLPDMTDTCKMNMIWHIVVSVWCIWSLRFLMCLWVADLQNANFESADWAGNSVFLWHKETQQTSPERQICSCVLSKTRIRILGSSSLKYKYSIRYCHVEQNPAQLSVYSWFSHSTFLEITALHV